jgi:hypothetical protein
MAVSLSLSLSRSRVSVFAILVSQWRSRGCCMDSVTECKREKERGTRGTFRRLSPSCIVSFHTHTFLSSLIHTPLSLHLDMRSPSLTHSSLSLVSDSRRLPPSTPPLISLPLSLCVSAQHGRPEGHDRVYAAGLTLLPLP